MFTVEVSKELGAAARALARYVDDLETELAAADATARHHHRPFGEHERTFLRRTAARGEAPKVVAARENPGVRVVPAFVDDEEARNLVAELRGVVAQYGASHVENSRGFFEHQMSHLSARVRADCRVNMLRATGRPELETQPVCPWRYGDDFDAAALPPGLRRFADKIAASPDFSLGPLRDVTINARKSTFFRLDPHVDPLDDGENVFILGLLSDTVLTFSRVGPPLSTVADQRYVSVDSWAPGEDIDVLALAGSLVHMSGDARSTWNHGIRLGVSADQLRDLGVSVPPPPPPPPLSDSSSSSSDALLFDWFGAPLHPLPRQPERISVVYAFAAARHPSRF
ncbi:hypothetical protein CTAYLR_007240 [Chrysophaeum taylorii]|uniref:Uncharacterized protein n=1 Tax=Chrysophaeum taylorii TaxID=2483200 RepID=A0AAD7UAP9_9STRA|nr:hypothetical protein CTAYLR_007240 [Chrysophaeum taylorii]